jgi:Tfp pilus assembly protein PilX
MRKHENAQIEGKHLMLRNEEGLAIVAVMLILVILTIIGIASTNVSNTEITIAGNEAVYQQNFYLAEGAALEAIEGLEGLTNPTKSGQPWIDIAPDTLSRTDLGGSTVWASGQSSSIVFADGNHTTQYYVDYIGVTSGSSLGVTSSKVHEFSVYGRDTSFKGGTTMVNLGYLMAYK